MKRTGEASKRVRRLLRECVGRAYEAALARELADLHVQFHRWETGELSAFDLSDEIHRFHNGPSRELYNRYSSNLHEMLVAHAIVTGLIEGSSVPEEVLVHISPELERERERGETGEK